LTQKTARKEYWPMQAGDVERTYADVQTLIDYIDYKPQKTIKEGVKSFVDWYKDYYKINESRKQKNRTLGFSNRRENFTF